MKKIGKLVGDPHSEGHNKLAIGLMAKQIQF